jgi:general secretion pathway protein D
MDIRSLIDEYAKQENLDIVIDPRLRGQVSLSSELTPGRISRDEFYGALLTHNFGAVEIDGTMRIIQTAMMKQHKLPSFDGRNRGQLAPSQIVNSVMKLRDHSAEKLAEKLKALIPIWGYIAADTDSNSLIVVATVESVERMVELIDDLNG